MPNPPFVLTFNTWLPMLVAPAFSRSISGPSLQAITPGSKYGEMGTTDDFFFDPGAGTLRVMPNPLREDFWSNDDYSAEWILHSRNEWRTDSWSAFKQIGKNEIQTVKDGGPDYDNKAIVPTWEPLQTYFDDRLDPTDWVWAAETETTLSANCGIALQFNVMKSAIETTAHPIAIAFGQFVLDFRDGGIAYLRAYDSDAAKWRKVGQFAFAPVAPTRGSSDFSVIILPGGNGSISVIFSGSAVDGNPATAMKSKGRLCYAFSLHKAGMLKPGDALKDPVPITNPNPLVIGIGKKSGVRWKAAVVKYAAPIGALSMTLGPYPLPWPMAGAPVLGSKWKKNNCGDDSLLLSVVSAKTFGGAYVPGTDDTFAVKCQMWPVSSNYGTIYSPELSMLSIDIPAEWQANPPAGHTAKDVSANWQLIRFSRSVDAPCGRFDIKLIENIMGGGVGGSGFLRLPTTMQLEVPYETADGVFANKVVAYGQVDDSKAVFPGGIWTNQIQGFDLLKKLEKRPVGNIKAISSLNLRELVTMALGAIGISPDLVYWNSKLPDIDESTAPSDWYEPLENATWDNLLRAVLVQYAGDLRVVEMPATIDGHFYLIQVYTAKRYEAGVTPLKTFYSAIPNGGPWPTYWERAKQGVFITYDPPEFSIRPAEFHRLVGTSATSVGPEARAERTLYEADSRAWTDPTYPDYEGERKVAFVAAPDLWAASQGGINQAIKAKWEKDSRPLRTVQFKGEWHSSIDLDTFFRLFTIVEHGGPIVDAGIWQIIDMDVELPSIDPADWRATYTAELARDPAGNWQFGATGL